LLPWRKEKLPLAFELFETICIESFDETGRA
jgi:hypothetical protein